ncbi:MAG: molybdenum cofactor biosynthesis protein MoaE [Gammaproteobacteria bacterium]
MAVQISEVIFDPWKEAKRYQDTVVGTSGKFGATAIFIGTMRDYNEGDDVIGMTLEYYPGMTENELEKIVSSARRRWRIIDALIIHRVGDILPAEPIVLVSVWASHRGDAFDASRFIMEALKSKAPFWKKELFDAGDARWVANNTDGYQKS